jgi:hypothetical protein
MENNGATTIVFQIRSDGGCVSCHVLVVSVIMKMLFLTDLQMLLILKTDFKARFPIIDGLSVPLGH